MSGASIIDSGETIGAFLRRLFPLGTRPEKSDSCDDMPFSPTDVFAAAASLFESCELYRRVIAFDGMEPGEIVVGLAEREEWVGLGRQWREGDTSIPAIEGLWKQLVSCYRDHVHAEPADAAPSWWRTALALLVIADEACVDLGFAYSPPHWLEDFLRDASFDPSNVDEVARATSNHVTRRNAADTFCLHASPFVARVVPKSRTPRVGCTMRTISHNLALLAPRSSAEVAWLRQPNAPRADHEPLNIVVVPFPFRIPATCFEARDVEIAEGKPASWGFFDIDQKWLRPPPGTSGSDGPAEIVDFLTALLEKAAQDVGEVDALVLPEGALDWDTYCSLVDRLASPDAPVRLEFLISGSSSYREERNNFVLTTTFVRELADGQVVSCVPITGVQAKHHRWRLDQDQIRGYALASALDPGRSWWEGISIGARRIGLTVFRAGSTFAAMICEDLARSEPCHAALRAVGPNLVFVLLMDGPQLPQRWAAQYSTVLADDPGSSVMTLTSLGLVDRSNASRGPGGSRTVAIWKDSKSGMVPLDCPKGADALVMTLSGVDEHETTLDGRGNRNAISWRYHGHQAVTLDPDARRRWFWMIS